MSLSRYAKTYLANRKKYANLNAFITLVSENDVEAQTKKLGTVAEGILDGKPIAFKDNICTKDLPTTAGSRTLHNFTSPYDATVVTLLKDGGAVVMGKTNLDQFGMGSHSTNSSFGSVKMQRYAGEEASAGGSSGGSALAVASSQCWAALGTDTGGSVRLPAAYTGTIGFKPSYGLISRWGVIAYANSLDTVGIFANNMKDVRTIFDKLNRHDPNDPTSVSPATRYQLGITSPDVKSLRIGIPLDYNISTLHPTIRNAWIRALKALSDRGHTLHPVRLPATQHALSAYYVLAPAEASSNLAKYDGIRFGTRADGIDGTPDSVLFAKTRGQGFGPEVQRRILLGAFSLSAQAIDNYFIQAQKVRRLVQDDFNNVFAARNPLTQDASITQAEGVDVILCPTAPTLAPALSKIKDQDPIHAYMNDVFTVPASLAGLPAISVPVPITKEENIAHHGDKEILDSAGLQFIGQYGEDKVVLHAAAELITALSPIKADVAPDMTAWGTNALGAATLYEPRKNAASAIGRNITITEAAGLAARARKVREPSKDHVQAIVDMDIARTTLEQAGKRFGLTRDQ